MGSSAQDDGASKKKKLPVIISSVQLPHSSSAPSGNLTHLTIHYIAIQTPFLLIVVNFTFILSLGIVKSQMFKFQLKCLFSVKTKLNVCFV